MSTLTLDKPKRRLRSQRERVVLSVTHRKYDFLMELLGNFNFVQVEENDGDSREEIITNLKEAAKSLKLMKEGKLAGIPAEELLNEI